MHFNTLATSALLVASALAVADPASNPMPYKLEKKANKLAKMSVHEIFGLAGRQDAGYAPTQNYCNGPGDTCQTACGPDSVQCPSTDGGVHCFVPSQGQQCCPDGEGNACDSGYYCTDNADGTWCCPNGLSLTACAALYGVTSLTSEAPITTIAAPTVTGATSPASESASVTGSSSSTFVAPGTSVTIYPTSSAPTGGVFPSYTQVTNGTVTTASSPVQITGAANQLARGALPALALAAGALLAM